MVPSFHETETAIHPCQNDCFPEHTSRLKSWVLSSLSFPKGSCVKTLSGGGGQRLRRAFPITFDLLLMNH